MRLTHLFNGRAFRPSPFHPELSLKERLRESKCLILWQDKFDWKLLSFEVNSKKGTMSWEGLEPPAEKDFRQSELNSLLKEQKKLRKYPVIICGNFLIEIEQSRTILPDDLSPFEKTRRIQNPPEGNLPGIKEILLFSETFHSHIRWKYDSERTVELEAALSDAGYQVIGIYDPLALAIEHCLKTCAKEDVAFVSAWHAIGLSFDKGELKSMVYRPANHLEFIEGWRKQGGKMLTLRSEWCELKEQARKDLLDQMLISLADLQERSWEKVATPLPGKLMKPFQFLGLAGLILCMAALALIFNAQYAEHRTRHLEAKAGTIESHHTQIEERILERRKRIALAEDLRDLALESAVLGDSLKLFFQAVNKESIHLNHFSWQRSIEGNRRLGAAMVKIKEFDISPNTEGFWRDLLIKLNWTRNPTSDRRSGLPSATHRLPIR